MIESNSEFSRKQGINHYVLSSDDPTKKNTGWIRDIAIQNKVVKGDIVIDGYSINLLEWQSDNKELVQPILPGKPITFIDKNKIKIDWKEESNQDEFEIGYVELDNGTFIDANVTWIKASGNSHIFDKLKNGKEYNFWVRPVKLDNKGPKSRTLYVSTNKPDSVKFDVVLSGKDRLDLKWDYAKNALGYKINLYDENKALINTFDVIENLGCEIDGLMDNKKYYVSIQSHNLYGESSWSNLKEVYTYNQYPLAPHNVYAKDMDNKVDLSWNASWVPFYFETFEYGDDNWNKSMGLWSLSKDFKIAVPSTSFVTNSSGENIAILSTDPITNHHVNLWVKLGELTGSFSIYLRYVDNKNYYALHFDQKAKKLEVYKMMEAKKITLKMDDFDRFKKDTPYLISFSVQAGNISYFVDRLLGTTNILDAEPLKGQGHLALYSKDQLVHYDKVDYKTNLDKEKYNIYASIKLDSPFELLDSNIVGSQYSFDNAKGYKYFQIESVVDEIKSYNRSFISTLSKP